MTIQNASFGDLIHSLVPLSDKVFCGFQFDVQYCNKNKGERLA